MTDVADAPRTLLVEGHTRVCLDARDQPPMRTTRRAANPLEILPTWLDISYTYDPRARTWHASWTAIGRRRRSNGDGWAARAACSMTSWHVEEPPDWITAAIHRHHPRPRRNGDAAASPSPTTPRTVHSTHQRRQENHR